MAKAADELAPLGVERTDFGGTFYAPLAFPGLVGEPFHRLRNGIRETMFGIGKSSIHDLSRDDLMVMNSDFFVPPTQ